MDLDPRVSSLCVDVCYSGWWIHEVAYRREIRLFCHRTGTPLPPPPFPRLCTLLTINSSSSTSGPTVQPSSSPPKSTLRVSAAVGKFDASLAALLFNYLSGSTVIGLANVLWIFFACNVLGAIITWFLIPETKGRDADVVDFEEWQEAAGREREGESGKEGIMFSVRLSLGFVAFIFAFSVLL